MEFQLTEHREVAMFTPAFFRRAAQTLLIAFGASVISIALSIPPSSAQTPRYLNDSSNQIQTTGSTGNLANAAGSAYAYVLDDMQTSTHKAVQHITDGKDATGDIQTTLGQGERLSSLTNAVNSYFNTLKKRLQDKSLPTTIVERLQSAEDNFQTRQSTLIQKLQTLKVAAAQNDQATVLTTLRQLADFLDQNQKSKQLRDPGHLPFQTPSGRVRKPAESQSSQASQTNHSIAPGTAHTALTMKATGMSEVLTAAQTLPKLADPTAAPTGSALTDDLAATEDAPLTDAIKAQAAALDNNPVKIHNWVRNHIDYVPGYGSIQGAAQTLQSGRGNSFDIASLEIALLRSAGIPARYVYGTIRLPVERAENWLGGVKTPEAALSLLSQASVPSQSVQAGGGITAIDLEHVWVEAWVDFIPSRGAVNRVGDSWIPLDPSFKSATDTAGIDLAGAVAINARSVLDAGKQGATCTADSAQGINVGNLQSAYDDYKDRLTQFLTQQGSDLTVGDVLGSRNIDAKHFSILVGSLPYKTITVESRFASIPDSLRWKFHYSLYADATAKGQDKPSASFSASLPSLAGKRLTLSFVPATQDDADTLASYMPASHADGSPILPSEFPSSLPAYLIQVKAELRLDGKLIASSGDFTLGTPLIASSGMFSPASGSWQDSSQAVSAGEYHAFAIDGQGISAGRLQSLANGLTDVKTALSTGKYADVDRDAVSGGLLQQIAEGYFALTDINTRIYQRASGVVDVRLPSYDRAVAVVTPEFLYGVPISVSFPGVTLNVDRFDHAAVDKTNASLIAYNRQSMERASAYAHLVLQQSLTDSQHLGTGMSAVKALASANAAGQTIRLIDQNNAATLAPALGIDDASRTEIGNAAAAGKTILAEDGTLTADGWTGSGYIVEDSQQGTGDYRLSGDANGVLYPLGGMGWLALASPAQAAVGIEPELTAGIQFDTRAVAMLGGMSSTRWQYFPGQTEVIDGLFLGQLNALDTTSACDRVATVITSSLSTTSGIGGNANGSTSNHPPVIQSAPVTQATAGQGYQYPVQATDPDGDKLNYRIVAGPSGLSVDGSGLISWSNPVAGSYTVTVRVDDGQAYVDQSYLLVVGQGGINLDLSLQASPSVANAGDPVTVSVVTNGGTEPITRSLTVDGKAVTLDANGQVTLTAKSGIHRLVATASDKNGSVTRESVYSVRDPSDTTPPVVSITAPVQDAELTAPTDITGSATDAHLAYYRLMLRPAGAGTNAWTEIGRGYTAVSNGKLGTLDTTTLANGLYDVALIAVDGNGQQTSTQITVEVNRNLKIGQFRLSYVDLNIDAAGIPIRVTRTYDTLRKGQALDFGHGWSVDYQNVQLRQNMELGLDWQVTSERLTLCLRPGTKHKIDITLPDGSLQRFTAGNATDCSFGQVPPVDIQFTPLAGTNSTLQVINIPNLQAQGGKLYDMDNGAPWDPTDYKLTTETGYVYYLKRGVGITKIEDPWGNTLTYTANGIIHSDGQSVTFTRDSQGRITSITDPSGKTIHYTYDANGDLASVANRLDQTSHYSYNNDHGLTAYTDPRGVTLTREVYDDQGRLIATIDADGKRIDITHDTANNQEVVTNRRGFTTTYTYDDQGNITQIVDALGNKTDYAFDALGNETQVTDPLGDITTRTFDATTGRKLSETDALGHTTSYGYNAAHKTQLDNVTDPMGNVTSYLYHGTAPTQISEPLGRTTGLSYDYSNGNLLGLSVAGQGSNYGYDTKGNRTSETDAAGNTTTYSFDANNRETSRSWQRTNAAGVKETLTSSMAYDADGHVTSETDPMGGVTHTDYNAAGKVSQVTDPLGRVTTYSYDDQARLIKTTYPDGSSDGIQYDANGNKIATTDRVGRVTRYSYDGLDRLIKTTYPDGSSTSTSYDAAGRAVASIDANGNRSVNTYDAAGRLTATTDPDGHTSHYQYDANGNRTQVTDPMGRVTTYTYDALNRLTKVTHPDGSSRSTVWRSDGRKQSETDEAGKTTSYAYDAVGHLQTVTQTDANGQLLTSYGYDEAGNKISQTDAAGHVTTWGYDKNNRLTSHTLPGGQSETFQYDLDGNRTAHTDFGGQTTRYAYDQNGRPIQTVYPDGHQVVVNYTADGQVSSRTDASGTTAWRYDAQGQVIQQTSPDGSQLDWSYDANGNISARSTPGGTTRYAYDGGNRLIRVTAPDGGVTTYTHNANGQPTKVQYPNGTETDYAYDNLGRLIQKVSLKGSQVIDGSRYILAADGKRTQVETFDDQSTASQSNGTLTLANPSSTKAYTYDALNRLTQENVSGRTQNYSVSYSYDNVGNRSQKTLIQGGITTTTDYVYDDNDRLTSETTTTGGKAVTTSYSWDANGNLIEKQSPTETTLYRWDPENRLIGIKQGKDAASAKTVASYVYNADGERVQKTEVTTSGNKVSKYLIDPTFAYPQTVQTVTTDNGTDTTTDYVWGRKLIERTRGGQGTFYDSDALGNIKALTDSNGNITDRYEYGAFGTLLNHTGSSDNAYRYTGEYFDDSAQLQYNRARWYDAGVGRFTASDPFSGIKTRPETLNKYTYAGDNPISAIDPSGFATMADESAAMNIAGGLAAIAIADYSARNMLGSSNGHWTTLWDVMMMSRLPALVQVAIDRQEELAKGKNKSGELHHTIPKYLCGAPKQKMSRVPYSVHKMIHGGLSAMEILINIEGGVVDRTIPIPLGWRRKSAVQELGEIEAGRAAIANVIQNFYMDTRLGEKGTPSVISVFEEEKPKFVHVPSNSPCAMD
jgi:RHS repeat-associated protein